MCEFIETCCFIMCCPFYCCFKSCLIFHKLYNPKFYLSQEISDTCFKVRLVSNDEVGIIYSIGENDWTNLGDFNDCLIKKLTNIIYDIIVDLNIGNYNLKSEQIQFISLQMKMYFKKCLVYYYKDEKYNFEVEPLEKRFDKFIEKKICKDDFSNFRENFKIMNDNSIIDLNTTKKNDIKILREKLYITIDSILEQKHDFYNIITSSLYYLEDIEKSNLREYNNRRKEQLSLND